MKNVFVQMEWTPDLGCLACRPKQPEGWVKKRKGEYKIVSSNIRQRPTYTTRNIPHHLKSIVPCSIFCWLSESLLFLLVPLFHPPFCFSLVFRFLRGKAVRCKEPLQLDTVEELEMHKKLRASAPLILTFCRCRFVFLFICFFLINGSCWDIFMILQTI